MKEGSIVGSGKNMLGGQFAEMSDISIQRGYKVFFFFGVPIGDTVDYSVTLTDNDLPALILTANTYITRSADMVIFNHASDVLSVTYIQRVMYVEKVTVNAFVNSSVNLLLYGISENVGSNGMIFNSPVMVTASP